MNCLYETTGRLLQRETLKEVRVFQQWHLRENFKNQTTHILKLQRNPMSPLSSNNVQSQTNLDGDFQKKVLAKSIQNKVTNGPRLRLMG